MISRSDQGTQDVPHWNSARRVRPACRGDDGTGITDLPPEILEEIFKICVSWLYTAPVNVASSRLTAQNHHRLNALSWIQVCSSWRTLSLSSSRLWRSIDLSSPHLAEECLRRSQHALIDIISSTSSFAPLRLFPQTKHESDKESPKPSTLSPLLSSLRSNTLRIRSISLRLSADDMYPLFHNAFSLSLPNLTSLTLKLPPSNPFSHQSTPVLPLAVPLVRYLSLEGVALNKSGWAKLQSLRYLCLKGLDEDACPSAEELLGILGRSPGLVVVRLEDWRPSCIEFTASSVNSDTESIYLPNLTSLTISSTQENLMSLFSFHGNPSLVLSPQTRSRLFVSLSDDLHKIFSGGRIPWGYDAHDKRRHRNDVSSGVNLDEAGASSVELNRLGLAQANHDRPKRGSERSGIALHANIDGGTPPIIQTIRLSRNGTHFLTSITPSWSTDSNSEADIAQSAIVFSLSSARPVGTHISSSLPHLLGSRLGCVTKLELNTGVLSNIGDKKGMDEGALRLLFGHLAELETLCIAFNDLSTLWKMLTQFRSRETITSLSHVLLPRLKNLSFGKPSDVWCNFSGQWFGSLLEFIKFRSSSEPGCQEDRPIESVEFLRCQGITILKDGERENEEMRELRVLVPVVVVQEGSSRRSVF